MCHAFEPTFELIQNLYKKSLRFRGRYHIHPVALSDYDGTAAFKVAAHGDWGTSSLNTFSPGLDETWPGRSDLYVDHTVTVDVYRLDTLYKLQALPIKEIDFFHCDTQGSDLKVLKGMGGLIRLIKAGCIEVPMNPSVKLYVEQHTRDEAETYLDLCGFRIIEVTNQMNEQNLHFERID